MRRALALGALVAGALLVLWALFAGDTDEEKIRARLGRLAAAVSVEGEGQNPVFRVAHLNQEFSELFTEDASVSIPELSEVRSGRQGLAALAGRATRYVEALDVSFEDIAVQLNTPKAAQVRARAKLDAVRPGGRPERDERQVSFRFVDQGGAWLIASVRAEPKAEAESGE
jgi:hypothetical protein